MDESGNIEITVENLSKIKAVSGFSKVRRSVNLLLIWGAVNTVGGLIFFNDNAFASVSNPSIGLLYLTYFPPFIGILMLILGGIGYFTKTPFSTIFAGICLIIIGVSNAGNDLVLMSVAKTHGMEIEGGFNYFWIFMGVMQVVWGIVSIKDYNEIRDAMSLFTDNTDREYFRRHLSSMSKAKDGMYPGLIKGTIAPSTVMTKGEKTEKVFGRIDGDSLILISVAVDNSYTIEKHSCAHVDFNPPDNFMVVETSQGMRKILLDPVSMLIVKQWLGEVPFGEDIKRIGKNRNVSYEFLRKYLSDRDNEVRSATIDLLVNLKGPELAYELESLLDDSHPLVRVAAVNAATKLRLPTLQPKIIEMTSDMNVEVREAAGKYLTVMPISSAVIPLESALQSEQDKRTMNALKKALAKCKNSSM